VQNIAHTQNTCRKLHVFFCMLENFLFHFTCIGVLLWVGTIIATIIGEETNRFGGVTWKRT